MNQLPSSLDFKDILPSSATIDAYFEAVDNLYQPENTHQDEQFGIEYFQTSYPIVSRHIDFAPLCYVDISFLEKLEHEFRIMEERGNRMYACADTHDKQAVAIMLKKNLQNLEGKHIPVEFHRVLFLLLGIKEYYTRDYENIIQSQYMTRECIDRIMKK